MGIETNSKKKNLAKDSTWNKFRIYLQGQAAHLYVYISVNDLSKHMQSQSKAMQS